LFEAASSLQTGFVVDGEARDIRILKTIQGKKIMAVARNNGRIKLFTLPGDLSARNEK